MTPMGRFSALRQFTHTFIGKARRTYICVYRVNAQFGILLLDQKVNLAVPRTKLFTVSAALMNLGGRLRTSLLAGAGSTPGCMVVPPRQHEPFVRVSIALLHAVIPGIHLHENGLSGFR
jgi:hypothetical protein